MPTILRGIGPQTRRRKVRRASAAVWADLVVAGEVAEALLAEDEHDDVGVLLDVRLRKSAIVNRGATKPTGAFVAVAAVRYVRRRTER